MPAPNATDSNFERTFADLAFARLRDMAPSLLDYLVGFQLIDKNDEDTHAIGVFGFKVGSEWIYAPMFFINGELKGHELLYIKGQDSFVPLTEEWVNYILNRRPSVLGEGETTPSGQLGMRQPDFELFSRSPYSGAKHAAARRGFAYVRGHVEEWAQPFLDVFLSSPKDTKYAALKTRFSLPHALKALGKQAAVNLIGTMRADERFADSVLQFYKLADLINFEKSAKVDQAEAKYSENASFAMCKDCMNYSERSCEVVQGPISPQGTCNYYKKGGEATKPVEPVEPVKSAEIADKEDSILFDEALYRDTPDNKVVVITKGDDTSAVTKDMSESDKAKLMRDQYVVKDERTDDQKSRVYKSELAATYSGPVESGLYPVLQANGKSKDMVIITSPRKLGWNRSRDFVVVIDPSSDQFGNYHPSDVLTGPQIKGVNDVGGLVDPKSLKYNDLAILIGPKGDATGVFEVGAKTTNSDGVTEIHVYGRNCPSSSSSTLLRDDRTYIPADSSYRNDELDCIALTGKDNATCTKLGNTLFVPNTYKALRIKAGKPPSKSYPQPTSPTSENLTLGSLTDVIAAVSKTASHKNGAHRLQLRTDGIRFNVVVDDVTGPRLSKLAVLKHLIVDHGLGQPEAETILKEAAPGRSPIFFIKYADNSAPVQGYFPDPMKVSDPRVNAPIQYPQFELQNLSGIDSSGNRELYRDDRYIDDHAKQYAMTAANQGQKEVLDTAVISGLVHTMDTDSAVDGYIGDLLLGLDRIGRILFMFYWHNDKFKDRYGQQDMVDLEDNLRNVFKNLGELTLFLKQKTIEPDAADSSEVELSEVLT